MAAADDDRDREIMRLRDRMHRAENLLTAYGLDHDTLKNVETRLKAVETEHGNRKAQESLVVALFKSPLLAWIATAAVGLWAYLTGRG